MIACVPKRIDVSFFERWKVARLRLVRMHYEAKVGHLGGNLSCIDALMVLFELSKCLGDEVLLSKGHSAGALYVALWSVGEVSEKELTQFHRDGTKTAGHPPPNWHPEIPFATGSLGHGLSLACGMALAHQMRNSSAKVFCLMSDGEWQEGSTWEALIFATHHRLKNLIVCIDLNGLQGLGSTQEVASMQDLSAKLRAFACDLVDVDGHDPEQIFQALEEARIAKRPTLILLKTIKGKGISFMENRMDSHYLSLTEVQYRQAIQELKGS